MASRAAGASQRAHLRPEVPHLSLLSTISQRLSPRSSPTSFRQRKHSSATQLGGRSSPRPPLISPSCSDGAEPRFSPRFGWELRGQQTEATPERIKATQERQKKAVEAHIARRRDSGSGLGIARNAERSKGRAQAPKQWSSDRRPNPLLFKSVSDQAALQPDPGALPLSNSEEDTQPQASRTPSFSKKGAGGIEESAEAAYDDVVEEHEAYVAAFGDTTAGDNDESVDACSFAGSDGDRVVELCQRAQNLIIAMGADVASIPTPPRTPTASMPTTTCAESHDTSSTALDSSRDEDEDEDPSTWPDMQPCELTEDLFRELGATVTPSVTPPVTPCGTRAGVSDTCSTPQISNAGRDESPAEWADLQPWLRGICPGAATLPFSARSKGEIQMSDLQFRISRLELQISQINGADEKPSPTSEVMELRRRVEAAHIELHATQQVARETQEQLRQLMQHAGIADSSAGDQQSNKQSGATEAVDTSKQMSGVLRSFSGSSQGSQILHRAPSIQSSVERSPVQLPRESVQLPRARSLDSATRSRFYPLACAGGAAPKRRSVPTPPAATPRFVDVPVRMCTSEQLMQVAKQRPVWLQKAAGAPTCSRAQRACNQRLCTRAPAAATRA